ncbi:MAG: phosphatidylserine/phosphatidylglycerophosphate/cardiolipin synthase family protein, partial [Gemmiger sp.]
PILTYYGDTNEALDAQKEALRTAERFIFMEYHAIEDSEAWRGLEEILVKKAAEGVDVRVFYDDMGSIGFISKPFARRLESEGIQCRVFNPLVPVLNVFMNNRDHRKITVVDGRVGFTGGYNLADEYFNLTHPYGQWKDSGVRLEGDAVRSLTEIFLEMWSATQDKPEDPTPFLPAVEPPQNAAGFVVPYADSPLDGEPTGEDVYLNLIKNARQYVYITTPYLIIDDEMQRELSMAARRGVDVRIVTPGIPDKKLVYRVTRSYYADLATAGVRIFEYTPGFVHAKQFVADDEVATCGTVNLDYRSLYLHFENGCWFCRCPAVDAVRRDFDMLFAQSAEVTQQYAGQRERCVRGVNCILRLFGPLM